MPTLGYPLDLTGAAPTNLVVNEIHPLPVSLCLLGVLSTPARCRYVTMQPMRCYNPTQTTNYYIYTVKAPSLQVNRCVQWSTC